MEPGAPQFDRRTLLFTRSGRILLGIAAALSLGAVILMHGDLTSDTFRFLNRREISIFGLTCAIGYAVLFAGMWKFWLNCDVASKRNRTAWFVILLVGCGYGSHIAYYAFMYLPAVAERLRNARGEATVVAAAQEESRRRVIGPFGWVLVAGWVVWILIIASYLAFRYPMYDILLPYAMALIVSPALMFVATAIYAIVTAFRFGMRRPADFEVADRR